MPEYQHKPLLEQVCQHLDGWGMKQEEGFFHFEVVFHHQSGAKVKVSGEKRFNFCILRAEFENKNIDVYFPGRKEISISAKKPPERIARELQRRLLDAFLPAYEQAMTSLQAAYAREVEAKAFMAQFEPLFPDCKIEGDNQPILYYHAPDLYEKVWGTPDSHWSGISHLTAELSTSCRESWEIKVSGYGKEALAELLNKVAITQPEPACGS